MLISKLQEDLKQSQLARDEVKVSTLRMLLSEIKNSEILKQKELTDDEILQVTTREAKKRRESITSFRSGNREDLALKEEAELKILKEYMPTQISDEELTKLVKETITELGANSIQDMGNVMSVVMGKVKGQADGGRVSELVKIKLNG